MAAACVYCGVPTEVARGGVPCCRHRRCLVKWAVALRSVRVGPRSRICLEPLPADELARRRGLLRHGEDRG